MDSAGVNIATGEETNIAISATYTYHLPAPYGNCLPTDVTQIDFTANSVLSFMNQYFVQGNNYTIAYTQLLCLKMCLQQYVYTTCGNLKRKNALSKFPFINVCQKYSSNIKTGCFDITLPQSQSLVNLYISNACATEAQLTCMNTAEDEFYANANLGGACYNYCPTECAEVKYDMAVNVASYPSYWYMTQLNSNADFFSLINRYFTQNGVSNFNYSNDTAQLKNCIAKVNVYYDNMAYNEIDEVLFCSLLRQDRCHFHFIFLPFKLFIVLILTIYYLTR